MLLCMVCNPEDIDVKLRMPVGRKEQLRGKLFSGSCWKQGLCQGGLWTVPNTRLHMLRWKAKDDEEFHLAARQWPDEFTSKSTKAWLHQQKIKVLKWPSQSPDMNKLNICGVSWRGLCTGNALAVSCAFEKRSGHILPSEDVLFEKKNQQKPQNNKKPIPQKSQWCI